MANKKKRKRPASPPTAQPKGETAKKGVATAPRDKPRSAPARPTSSRRGRLSARSSWTLLGVGIVAIVGAIVGFSILGSDGGGTGVTSAAAWDVPALQDDLDPDGDGRVTLDDFEGTPTVVNFFASWCIPCLAEHPLITALSRDSDIQVVGINYKNKPADAITWLERHGDPYARIGADTTGRVAIDWGVYGMPESFILDRNGRIRFKQVGPITPEILRTRILPIIAELKK